MKYVRITQNQVDRAKVLFEQRKSWREIGAAVGVSHYGIRCKLDPKFKSKKSEGGRNYRAKYYGSTGALPYVTKQWVPDHVTEEYLRATSRPQSLTASVFGDPLPGRSALDRRNGGVSP